MELHELIDRELDLARLEFEQSAPPEHVRVDHAIRELLDQRGLCASVHVMKHLHLSYRISPTPAHRRKLHNERIADFDGSVTLTKQIGLHGYDYLHTECTGTYVLIGYCVETDTQIEHHPVAAVYVTPDVDLAELAASIDRHTGRLLNPQPLPPRQPAPQGG